MNKFLPLLLIVIAVGSFALGSSFDLNFSVNRKPWLQPTPTPATDDSQLANQVLPESGVELPITWNDLGAQLVKTGVIDPSKFTPLADTGNIKIDSQNARLILNSLWALGLGNKNPILDTGPMVDKQFGGAGNFASTGGWSLAKGNAMSHYSKHRFITLTAEQQQLVEEVAKNIFRPCCNNATYFPDCNHGMAMLALLELMASQGINKEDMYRYALAVNSYWFPDTYVTIAKYKASQGVTWDKVDPKEVLGESYSSATGYRRILSQVAPAQFGGGGGCGV